LGQVGLRLADLALLNGNLFSNESDLALGQDESSPADADRDHSATDRENEVPGLCGRDLLPQWPPKARPHRDRKDQHDRSGRRDPAVTLEVHSLSPLPEDSMPFSNFTFFGGPIPHDETHFRFVPQS
jgi:hypothetical protein